MKTRGKYSSQRVPRSSRHRETQSPPNKNSQRSHRQRAKRVTFRLESIYGSPRHGNKYDPIDELIFIILSQMTTQPSFDRVFTRLKKETESWDRVIKMPLSILKELIADAGLSNQKGSRIKTILERIKQDFGEISLAGLHNLCDKEVVVYLTSLPGVGIKTAKCVMMYSLGRQVLPVDTHVERVAKRLGLLNTLTPISQIHSELESVVPHTLRYAFHVNALSHGRQVCRAIRPKCPVCQLRRMCQYLKAKTYIKPD